MFRNLLQFWKGKDFLNQVLEDFTKMLDDTEVMFGAVCRRLIHNEEVPDLQEHVYTLDQNVNEKEKSIRKRIIEHLALQPSVDVSTSLLLMSVVKDAERLGDYAKNLYEVIKLLHEPINKKIYSGMFNNIEDEIAGLFKETRKAFIESDEDKAARSWDVKRQVVKRCEDIIQKLAKSNLSVNEAVCYTLMARYFKRLAAHLTNIATSVILPLTDLDYFDERKTEE